MPNWVRTYSGKKFCITAPTPDQIDLVDIAHGLSNICRFTGQTKEFYSVAQHSIYVAAEVYDQTGDVKKAIAALLHDAPEAYLTDVPSPLKVLLPEYKVFENLASEVIKTRFNLVDCPEIHEADLRSLVTEMRDLMNESEANELIGSEPFTFIIESMPPKFAKELFIKKYLSYMAMLATEEIPKSSELS